jgi:hypothetical protein
MSRPRLRVLALPALILGAAPSRAQAPEPLPDLAAQNAAWVADVAGNVASGLQAFPCARMPAGPADLYGRESFVDCARAPRLCSAGPDGTRRSADDVCAPLVQRDSSAPRDLGTGWERRFLLVTRGMAPPLATAEGAVVSFFAGALRGDGSHRRAAPPESEWDDTMRYKIETYDRFPFRSVRLDGLLCVPEMRMCRFRVFMAPNGGTDSGVVSQRSDGTWRVTSPPT